MDVHLTNLRIWSLGDSRFPEAFGSFRREQEREDMCYVNKAGCTSCLVRERESAMFYLIPETKHGSWRRTREEQEERGWQRKSPFPLSCASTSCVGRKSLVGRTVISLLVVRRFHPSEQRRFEPAAIGGELRNKARAHTHTHKNTHTSLSWLSQWKTYILHPHSRLTGNSAAWNKQALPVLTGARSQRGSNQNPMSCPLHHYHHHSGDITAHLLIATRPYLCLQPQTPTETPSLMTRV